MGCLFSSEKVEAKSRLIHAHNGANEGVAPGSVKSTATNPHSPRGTASRATVPPSRNSTKLRPSSSATLPASGLPSIDTLTENIEGKWTKPISTLPIATDLPRLVNLTSIYVGDDKRDVTNSAAGDQPEHERSIEQVLFSALLTLSIHLHDPTTLGIIKQHFWDYHKGDIDGEVARNFGLFLKSHLQDESNNVMCVLKLINQAILAPAIIALKMAIPTLPFKDFRNSWRVKIFINNDDSVDVLHVRREQSFNSQHSEEMRFEFVWELRIKLVLASANGLVGLEGVGDSSSHLPPILVTAGKHIKQASLQIVEVALGHSVPPNNKEKILGDMGRLLSSNCVVTTIPA